MSDHDEPTKQSQADDLLRKAASLRDAISSAPVTEVQRKERITPDKAMEIIFWYKNHRGKEEYRRVRPISIRFGSSEWHTEPQWLMLADDLEYNKRREFAMRDMRNTVGPTLLHIQQP